jgi:hypothetical protein
MGRCIFGVLLLFYDYDGMALLNGVFFLGPSDGFRIDEPLDKSSDC